MSNTLKMLSLLSLLLLACGPEGTPECPDGCTTATITNELCRYDDCTPPEPKQSVANVAVTIKNGSPVPRVFNAGWGFNTWLDPHPSGWLIPDETLQPGEVRSFSAETISGFKGDEVVIGVSGYYTPEPKAWARQEPRFVLEAGTTSCAFTYSLGEYGVGLMTTTCPTASKPITVGFNNTTTHAVTLNARIIERDMTGAITAESALFNGVEVPGKSFPVWQGISYVFPGHQATVEFFTSEQAVAPSFADSPGMGDHNCLFVLGLAGDLSGSCN